MSVRASWNFPSPLTQVPINVNATGDTVLVVGVAGKRIKVFRLKLIVAAAVVVLIKDGSVTLDGPLSFSANEGMILDFTDIDMPPWDTTSPGNSLILNSGITTQIGGNMDYLLS